MIFKQFNIALFLIKSESYKDVNSISPIFETNFANGEKDHPLQKFQAQQKRAG